MPRLHKLDLTLSETTPLAILLSPTLRILHLCFRFEDGKKRRYAHIATTSLLQNLPLMAPDLEHLTVDSKHSWGWQTLRPCIQSFRLFTHLKTISMQGYDNALDGQMLHVLSSITTLQNLSCSIGDLSGPGTSPLNFPEHAFQELTKLTILEAHCDHLLTFIRACQFPNLKYMELFIASLSSTGQLRNMITVLCQHCNPTVLSSFVVSLLDKCRLTVRLRSLMEHFEPLLVLGSITSFILAFNDDHSISISDDDLARISVAWPRLTTFVIIWAADVPQYSQLDVARPTLSGIIELARRCPRLVMFHIPELGTSIIPAKGAAPPLRHRGLHSMAFRNIVAPAPPSEPEVYLEVATVIDRVFPSLDLESTSRENYEDFNGAMQGWADVLRFVKAMHLGRENGSRQG